MGVATTSMTATIKTIYQIIMMSNYGKLLYFSFFMWVCVCSEAVISQFYQVSILGCVCGLYWSRTSYRNIILVSVLSLAWGKY